MPTSNRFAPTVGDGVLDVPHDVHRLPRRWDVEDAVPYGTETISAAQNTTATAKSRLRPTVVRYNIEGADSHASLGMTLFGRVPIVAVRLDVGIEPYGCDSMRHAGVVVPYGYGSMRDVEDAVPYGCEAYFNRHEVTP